MVMFAGTIAPIVVLFVTTKLAGVPLKVTLLALVKLSPLIRTVEPEGEFVGLKLLILAGM